MINLTIFTKSTPHALRAIALATFPPAFIILLIQGILAGKVNPAIGILPLFFSSAFSALLLANEKKCGCQASGLAGTPMHLIFDILIAVGLLVCLILSWVFMTIEYSIDNSLVMLGTYGTNFLACNFLVHTYFIVMQLRDALSPGVSYPLSCPQCQNTTFSVGNIKLVSVTTGLREGYMPLLDRQGEPRVSSEEVSAPQEGEMA